MGRLTSDQKGKILVTADQVVTHEGKVLEKPLNADEAREMMQGYGRSPCSTVGSCVLTDTATGKRVQGVDVATVHFSPFPSETIESLIAEGEVFYCAGGLMVEHPLIRPCITKMEGSEDSVMGLSPELLERLWTEMHA
jgi:septum formation protein